jgi:hypothetical protein
MLGVVFAVRDPHRLPEQMAIHFQFWSYARGNEHLQDSTVSRDCRWWFPNRSQWERQTKRQPAGLPQGQGRSVSRLPNAINFSVHQRWKRSALQAQVAVASSVVLATNSRCMPAKCLIKCPKLDCVVFYVLLLKIMWLAVCISER